MASSHMVSKHSTSPARYSPRKPGMVGGFRFQRGNGARDIHGGEVGAQGFRSGAFAPTPPDSRTRAAVGWV